MNVVAFKDYLPTSMWGIQNLRDYKDSLFRLVADSVCSFKPINADSYNNNPMIVWKYQTR